MIILKILLLIAVAVVGVIIIITFYRELNKLEEAQDLFFEYYSDKLKEIK